MSQHGRGSSGQGGGVAGPVGACAGAQGPDSYLREVCEGCSLLGASSTVLPWCPRARLGSGSNTSAAAAHAWFAGDKGGVRITRRFRGAVNAPLTLLFILFFCFKPAGLCELRGWLQRKAAAQPARDTISYLRVPSRHVLKQAAYLAHSPSLPLLLRHKRIVQVWWNTFSRI